jgi:hypothetical protein
MMWLSLFSDMVQKPGVLLKEWIAGKHFDYQHKEE